MNKVFIIIFLQSFTVFGQLKGSCFEHFNPLSYGIGDKITFLDSTFEYRFIEGLAGGVVKGKYSISGDTVLITSEYQETDFTLVKVNDSAVSDRNILFKIKQIENSQVVDVSYMCSKDSIKFITGKTSWRSNTDRVDNELDTVIIEYQASLRDIKSDKLEVAIWRKNTLLVIQLEKQFNTYILDLTKYPSELDYRFFKSQRLVIIKNKLYFLDDENMPEKDYYPIQTRKGITISKKKKIKEYTKCT